MLQSIKEIRWTGMARSVLGLLPLTILLAQSAYAGGFTIMPVRLELSNDRRVGSFSIRNDADSPVTVDVRSVAWTQTESGDEYLPTRDIILTPTIFSLESGASQVVRVGLRREPDHSHELSYRVFVTEIPAAPQAERSGVAMTLRLSVPLFLKPSNEAKPELQWRLQRDDSGGLRLAARNNGTAHVQLANLQLRRGARVVARQPSPAYLLPGREREWPLQLESHFEHGPEPLLLEGYSDAGDVRTEVHLP